MATLEAKRGGRTKAITPVGLFNYSNHFLQQLSAFTRSEVGDPSTSRRKKVTWRWSSCCWPRRLQLKQKVVKIAGGPGARAQKAGAPRIRWHSGVQPKAAQKNCRPRCRWSCLTTCRNKTGAMLTPCYSHANSSAFPRWATSPRGQARPPARRGETAGGQCRCGSPGH